MVGISIPLVLATSRIVVSEVTLTFFPFKLILIIYLRYRYTIFRTYLPASVTFNTFFLIDRMDFIGRKSNGIHRTVPRTDRAARTGLRVDLVDEEPSTLARGCRS